MVGGGNIVRGVEVSSRGVSRPTGDTMGMLATVMNCLALEAAIERRGHAGADAVGVRHAADLRAVHPQLRRTNISPRAGSCCSAAEPAIRSSPPTPPRCCGPPKSAREAVLKATNVDGVYSADPKKDPSAKRFDRLTHSQAIEGGYKVMDATAFALARETSLPIIVFSIAEPGSIGAILRGTGRGTIVAG